MFCTNCGNKLNDTAKFCTNCGKPVSAPVVAEAVAPVAEAVAPVAEAVAPVAEAVAPVAEEVAPVAETVAPVAEEVAPVVAEAVAPVAEAVAPVAETVAPVAEEVAPVAEAIAPVAEAVAPVAEAVAPVAEAVAPVAEEVAPVAETVAPVAEAVAPVAEEVAPVAETVAPVAEAVAPVAEEVAPIAETVAPVAEAVAPVAETVAPAKKKKGKTGIIIGASAAAVVVGGASVGYFGFNDDITRLVMGEVGYAKMVEANSYSALNSGEYSDTLSESLGEALTSGFVTYFEDYKNDELDENPIFGNLSLEYEGESYPVDSSDIGDFFNSFMENDKGVKAEFGIKLTIGDTLRDTVNEEEIEALDKALEIINGLKISASVINSGTDKMSFDISDSDGDIIGVDVYFDKDSVIIAIPELTEKSFKFDIEISDEEDNDVPEEEIEEFSDEELKRLTEEAVKIYFGYYDSAEIDYINDTVLSFEGTEVKGTGVKVTLTAESLSAMKTDILALFENDEYFKSYMIKAAGLTDSEYAGAFDELEGTEIEESIDIINVVDGFSNVLGKSLQITDEENKDNVARFDFFSDKEKKNDIALMTVTAADDGEKPETVTLSLVNTSETKGTGVLNIKMTGPFEDADDIDGALSFSTDFVKLSNNEAITTGKDNTNATLHLVLNYSDITPVVFMGNPTFTGSYEVTIGEADTLIEKIYDESTEENEDNGEFLSLSADLISESEENEIDPEKLKEALLGLKVSLNATLENNTFAQSAKVEFPSVMSVEYNISMTELSETVTAPSGDNVLDINDIDAKVGAEIQIDALGFLKDFADRYDLYSEDFTSESIDEQIKALEDGLKFYEHYADYNEYSKDYIRNCAYYISAYFSNMVLYADSFGGENKFDPSKLSTVYLYFDADGKCNVIDDGNIAEAGGSLDSFIAELEGLNDDSFRNLYAEVTVIDSTPCVFTVYTDDKNDIPSKTPEKFNFYDGVFEWTDVVGVVDTYVCGTYPSLDIGVSETESKLTEIITDSEKLNGYSKDISVLVDELLKEYGETAYLNSYHFTSDVIFDCNEDGRWIYNEGLSDSLFTEEFIEAIEIKLSEYSSEKDVKSCSVKLSFGFFRGDYENFEFLGSMLIVAGSPLNVDDYNLPDAYDFADGYFNYWTDYSFLIEGADNGLCYDYTSELTFPVGTYCIKTDSALVNFEDYVEIVKEKGDLSYIISGYDYYVGDWTIMDTESTEASCTIDENADISLTIDGTTYELSATEFYSTYFVAATSDGANKFAVAVNEFTGRLSIEDRSGEESTVYTFEKL